MKRNRWRDALPWLAVSLTTMMAVALLASVRALPGPGGIDGTPPRAEEANEVAASPASAMPPPTLDIDGEPRVAAVKPHDIPSPPPVPVASPSPALPFPALQAPAAPTPRPSRESEPAQPRASPRPSRPAGQAHQIVPLPKVPAAQGNGEREIASQGQVPAVAAREASGRALRVEYVVPPVGAQQNPAAVPRRSERTQALELAAREADQHTQRGFELASHGAYFASRAQFIQALRRIVQALDTERRTSEHSRALAAGLTAMREAQDFLPDGSRLEADLDLPSIVAGHRTPVLKNAAASMTLQTALQAYYTFAQSQLGVAGGGELAASMACYGLGKLHRAASGQQADAMGAAQPKSMTFLQSAILIHPQNYLASNELGALLARAGRNEDARKALEHSVSIQPSAAGWHNLAVVCRSVGHVEAARKASWQADALSQQESLSGGNSGGNVRAVQWLDPVRFAQSSRPSPGTAGASAPVPPQQVRLTGFAAPPDGPATPLETPNQPYPPYSSYPAFQPPQFSAQIAPYASAGVQSSACRWCRQGGWEANRAIFWQGYAQGEYVARARTAHVSEYRMRPDDQLDMVYRLTREETSQPYRFNVGDEIRVESLTDANLNRDLILQPDGTITMRLLGQVKATGKTVTQLRDDLEKAYLKYYKVPAISVTPLKMNTKLEDLRATVDRRAGIGGQSQLVRVTPEGTISLPAIGCVPAQGLTLRELQQELNERYREQIEGMEVIPVLVQRAPRYVYVLGEVRTPGRFELVGPTTVIQAVGMAGGWNVGANLRQVVVFRRDDAWQLLATMLNLQAPLYGNDACPSGEIWLSDSDVVIVPKGKILIADEFIDLVFTRGVYGVFPFSSSLSFSNMSRL